MSDSAMERVSHRGRAAQLKARPQQNALSDRLAGAFRRLAWRLGRRVYLLARGEPNSGSIQDNGERLLQSLVLQHAPISEQLVVVDIGANQGEWTASFMAAAPPERLNPAMLRIEAFEPVPETAVLFREAISRLSGAACVRLHECALSATEGHAQIAVYSAGAGTNTLHFDREGRADVTRVDIARQTLAGFSDARGLKHIHFAKCDTEGHDLWVMQGARPLLEAGRIDILQFEYNHRWVFGRAFLKDVFELIDGLDYTLVRIEPGRFPLFDAWHPELDRFFQANFALVHARALAWLPLRRGRFDGANTYA